MIKQLGLILTGFILIASCNSDLLPEMNNVEDEGLSLQITFPSYFNSTVEESDTNLDGDTSRYIHNSRAFLSAGRIEVQIFDIEENLLLDETTAELTSSPISSANCYFPNISVNSSVFAVMHIFSRSEDIIPTLSGTSNVFTVHSGYNAVNITLIPTNPINISIPFSESMAMFPTSQSNPNLSGEQSWYSIELTAPTQISITGQPGGDSYSVVVLANSQGQTISSALSTDFFTSPPVYGGDATLTQDLEPGKYFIGVMGVAHSIDQKYEMIITIGGTL